MKVLDSIHEDGAKLIEISPESVADLQAEQPGIRIVPEVFYYPARAPRAKVAIAPKVAAARATVSIDLTIVSDPSGSPIAGAKVVAFTDFASKSGLEGVSDAKGRVSLAFGKASVRLERLYVYSESGFWNLLETDVKIRPGMQVALRPLDLTYTDCLRYFYTNVALSDGKGVKVGVIDTGVGPHKDLSVLAGENLVLGEDSAVWTDNGAGHGTHVAGIIAAKGSLPDGVRGIAPGVDLYSYRVFGKGEEGASNFAISKAIDRAVADGCHLINMSLGGGPFDEATHSAITDARAKGSVVIVAAGNDSRNPVSFPANDALSLAVSALGRKGTFPAQTVEEGDIDPPPGTDSKNFIASFSNVGPEIVLTGPGVGIISTFPQNRYAVMDGTSMACPAVIGAAARLLATKPDILNATPDQSRSDAIVQLILGGAKTFGFPATLEGRGMIL